MLAKFNSLRVELGLQHPVPQHTRGLCGAGGGCPEQERAVAGTA